jgi:hypothetical protein
MQEILHYINCQATTNVCDFFLGWLHILSFMLVYPIFKFKCVNPRRSQVVNDDRLGQPCQD